MFVYINIYIYNIICIILYIYTIVRGRCNRKRRWYILHIHLGRPRVIKYIILDECNTLWGEPSQAAISATPTA